MHGANNSPVDGDYYTLPLVVDEDITIPGRRVAVAVSLAGARKGDYVLARNAEITAPASVDKLNTQWGVFARVRLENRRTVDHKPVTDQVDAWHRY